MKRITPLLLFSASVAVGCTQLEDSRIEARQRRMARAAYVTSPGACNGMPHSVDYAKGFEEGYYDVASGGDGCPPALPPKKYWSATYNSPVGQEHVKAWFQGFRDGAAAAKADGVASYGTIYVSDEHRNGVRRAAQGPTVAAPPPVAIPPTPGAPLQVPITGPQPLSTTPPPAPMPTLVPPGGGAPKPPMSDAQKTPTLRNVPPPPSGESSDLKEQEPLKPAPVAVATPKPAAPTPMPTILPVMAPPAPEVAPIPAVAAPTKPTTPPRTPEPVRLKLPELELPEGFAPEAGLGVPTALGTKE